MNYEQIDSCDLYLIGSPKKIRFQAQTKESVWLSCLGKAQIITYSNNKGILFWPDKNLPLKSLPVGGLARIMFQKHWFPVIVNCRIKQLMPGGKIVLDVCDYTSVPQKRMHFRVPMKIPVLFWRSSDLNDLKKKAETVDVSGGGLLLQAPILPKKSKSLYLNLFTQKQLMSCSGKIIWLEQADKFGKTFLIGMEYQGLSELDRDQLISICFAKHRQDLRNRCKFKESCFF